MGEATRKGRVRRQRKDLAKDVSEIFTFYVNPQAKPLDPLTEVQAKAYPILLKWKETGRLKEFLLKATLQYAGQALEKKDVIDTDLLLRMLTEHFRAILKDAQISVSDNPTATGILEDVSDNLSEDLIEFASNYL